MIPFQIARAIRIMSPLIDHWMSSSLPFAHSFAVEPLREGGQEKIKLDDSLTSLALCPDPLQLVQGLGL